MNGVAQVGDTSAVVTLDYDGNVLYFWQTIGSSARFSKNQVTSGRKFGSAPSVAGVGDQAVIAVVGPDQTLWVYQQPSSTIAAGVSWTYTVDLGFSISQAPSIAQAGDFAVIAVVDDSGALWSFQQDFSTGHLNWSQQKVAGSAALQSPSVARVGDSAVIAAIDDQHNLLFYWKTIGTTTTWSPGQLVDGPAKSGRSFAYPSVAQSGDASVVIAVDNTGSLWSYWQTIGGTTWNPNPVLLTELEGPFSTLPYPSIAQVGDSAVIAAANSNPDISLWFYWQANPAAQWIPERVPSGTISASPSVAQVGNSSVITASDNNGDLSFFWQTIGTGGWTAEPVANSHELGG